MYIIYAQFIRLGPLLHIASLAHLCLDRMVSGWLCIDSGLVGWLDGWMDGCMSVYVCVRREKDVDWVHSVE